MINSWNNINRNNCQLKRCVLKWERSRTTHLRFTCLYQCDNVERTSTFQTRRETIEVGDSQSAECRMPLISVCPQRCGSRDNNNVVDSNFSEGERRGEEQNRRVTQFLIVSWTETKTCIETWIRNRWAICMTKHVVHCSLVSEKDDQKKIVNRSFTTYHFGTATWRWTTWDGLIIYFSQEGPPGLMIVGVPLPGIQFAGHFLVPIVFGASH